MHRRNRHNKGFILSLRQLGSEKIVLPIGSGLAISWLTLQVVLFFVACVICSCCSLSSYAWSSIAPSLLTPRPTQIVSRTPIATDAGHGKPQPLTATPFDSPVPTATSDQNATLQPSLTPTSPTLPATTPPRPTLTGTLRSPATSSPYIVSIEHNPTGTGEDDDPSTDFVDKELVIIENPGPADQDMTGWTLNNNQLDTYQFPDGFILRGETVVYVWTKRGTDTEFDLYWGSEKEMWGSKEGVAYLRDHTETLLDTLNW